MKTARWIALGVLFVCVVVIYLIMTGIMVGAALFEGPLAPRIMCGLVGVILLATGVYFVTDDDGLFLGFRMWWRGRPWNAS